MVGLVEVAVDGGLEVDQRSEHAAFLRGVAVADYRLEAAAIGGGEGDRDTRAHAADLRAPKPAKIRRRI